ncbi:Phosphoribosylamine--glycine ligase [Pseudoclavibacter triregionum]|nr:Phosphoribosylamine--glycine ligase [Pseudoclavibacter triregionum]
MKILVLGSGAREHALVAALAAEGRHDLICAPGNPGIAQSAATIRIDANKPDLVGDFAEEERVDLVVVGPEAPLVAGVADELRRRGIPVFGPNQAAARLEGSKTFAKEVMEAAGVPTGVARLCATREEAEAALDVFGAPYVVKADGLASGKGVLVTSDRDAALVHADTWLPAGPVLIEEFLDGREVSQFVITDGETCRALPPAQDFKRLLDGDEGPNTGGMGAYTPVPFLDAAYGSQAAFSEEVVRAVAQPVIDELRRRGEPFQGVLYCGLIVTARGIRVIEFNARFGDPETQVVLPRLAMPLSELLLASANGTLASAPQPLPLRPESAVTLVLASEGYPDALQTGRPLSGLDEAAQVEGASVLHAATGDAGEGEGLRATGGRVLNVVALGADLAEARSRAYEAMGRIGLEGGQVRRDIAEAAAAEQAEQTREAHAPTPTLQLPTQPDATQQGSAQ